MAIPISELLEDVLALSARHEVEKKVHSRLELDRTINLQGYPARLRQAFANLVRNAIEASAPGGEIRVRVTRSVMRYGDGETPAVRVSIADRGAGISPAHREKIFDAFYTTKEQKGSGIGLWLTVGVVQEHHGKLQLRTATASERHGSVFSVLLPLP